MAEHWEVMSSDERLDDRSASGVTESFDDVASKKKKSFHPIRRLKRFFTHSSGNSQNRSGDSGSSSSVLLKANSTTDVVIGAEVPVGDDSGCLQKHSKQISISADSIFSVEKTTDQCTDQCPNVSTISSEAVLCSNGDWRTSTLLQHEDDITGLLPNARTSIVKHSQKCLDSDLYEAEEDFFKDSWMISSELSLFTREADDGTDEASFQKEIDLNLVKRNSSLTSSAAVHRLAIKPKGKRISSIYQQKLNCASSIESQKSVLLFSPVKKENFPNVKVGDQESIRTSEVTGAHSGATSHRRESAELEGVEKTQAVDREELEKIGSNLVDGENILAKSIDTNDSSKTFSSRLSGVESHLATSDLVKLEEKELTFGGKTEKEILTEICGVRSKEKSMTTEETDNFNEQILISANVATDDKPNFNEILMPQLSPTTEIFTDSASSEQPQTASVAAAAAVVRRQKVGRVALPSAEEIQVMAVKRQSCAFSTETEQSGEERPTSKRYSVSLVDRQQLPLAKASADSELTQMFSKFQRRSSQKKQVGEKESKKIHLTESTDEGREEQSCNTMVAVAKTAGQVNEQHIDKIESRVGVGKTDVILTSAESIADVQVNSSLANKNGRSEGGNRMNRSIGRYLPATDSVRPAKIRREVEIKGVENAESNNNNEKKTGETSGLNRAKAGETGNELDKGKTKHLNRTTEDTKGSAADQLKGDKTKSVKKSCSISYKATASALSKSPVTGQSPGDKARPSSQSEMAEPTVEAAPKTNSTQAWRRGSLTYTNLKTSTVPVSDSSGYLAANTAGNAAAVMGQQPPRDMQCKTTTAAAAAVPVTMQLCSTVRSVRSGPSGAYGPCHASSPAETLSANRHEPSGATSVLISVPKIISPRAMHGNLKPVNVAEEMAKAKLLRESKEEVNISPSSQSSGNNISTTDTEALSSAIQSSRKDCATLGASPPKSTSPIRPAGAARNPHGKPSQEDGRLEWMGMVRQKTKAWTEGKMEDLEKASCK